MRIILQKTFPCQRKSEREREIESEKVEKQSIQIYLVAACDYHNIIIMKYERKKLIN
jgi:hypothetical protein